MSSLSTEVYYLVLCAFAFILQYSNTIKCQSAGLWFIVSITHSSHISEEHDLIDISPVFSEIAPKKACDGG